jgi:ferrochelatase
MKTAIVILNLGGPDSLDTIEPFLFNLFSDPDIFKIPFGQKLFAKFISKKRAPKVAEQYKAIGGNSPINKWTELQRKMLEEKLRNYNSQISVYTAMRYWKPLIKETAEIIKNQKIERIILLPLYPHYSISTTGSSFNEWERHFNIENEIILKVKNYYSNKNYITAINERITEALLNFDKNIRKDVQLVFSAHGTPVSFVKKGDPYSHQIKETVELVMKQRNFSHSYYLCYQSKVGPVKWLTPSTEETIKELSNKNKKHLLIIPISFVSDHVETLYELNIEYRKIANEYNINNYIVMEGLNDSKLFINALFEETIKIIESTNER